MFWYLLFMALVGFVAGFIFHNMLLISGLTKEEKLYLNSFCRALKEGKYKVKQSDEDE